MNALTVPVTIRKIELGSGEIDQRSFVTCPVEGGPVSLKRCQSCPRLSAHSLMLDDRVTLRCEVPNDSLDWTVADVMSTRVTCLHQELTLGEAVDALEKQGLGSAPLVDREGHWGGHIDLNRLIWDRSAKDPELESTRVDEFVVPGNRPLLAKMPLADAVAELARLDSRGTAVIDDCGRVVGVISTQEVMDWWAKAGLRLR